MKNYPSLQYIYNREIDKQRWDSCIAQSPYGLIYATTLYLDNTCSGWSALVGENYDWVMPVTSNRKLGIPYLYQPSFTQQLGVFARNEFVVVPWAEIMGYLKKTYPFWEINLNYATPPFISNNVEAIPANNFVLFLNQDYKVISKHYSGILKKNLKRSLQVKPVYRRVDYLTCIEAYKDRYGPRLKHLVHDNYEAFKRICFVAAANNQVVSREVVDVNGTPMANALLLLHRNRLYNIMNTTFPEHKKYQGNHFLIDSLIREFAGQDWVLDFEGSDLPGVKVFYQGFGAINQAYFMVRFNNLPWPLRLFK